MKKSIWLTLGLAITVVACQTVVPASVAPISTPALQESLVSKATAIISPPAQTEIPSKTSSPFPAPKPITCTDDSCLEACLQRIEQLLPQTKYKPLTGAYAEGYADVSLVYYDVQEGQLGTPHILHVPDSFQVYQKDTDAQQALWEYASSIMTPEVSRWISQFETFISTGASAFVRPSDPDRVDRSHWTLRMDVVYAQNPADVTHVLVHEAGHLVVENTEQIPASEYLYGWEQNPVLCKEFLSMSGCSKPDSYINQFYQIFWKDIYEEWETEVDRRDYTTYEEYQRLLETFYNKHQESFLGPYQTSNIEEDMAESFALFVLNPPPTGDSLAEQKIRFFYDYPELVALRQKMIQGICSYTGE